MDIACIRGDVDLLKFLIDKGIDLFYINKKIPAGHQITPLTHLAYMGNSNPTSENGKLIKKQIEEKIYQLYFKIITC